MPWSFGPSGFRRHPALLGRAVEDREIELLLAGVERGEQVEHLVDDHRRPRVGTVDLVDHDDGLEAHLERLRHHELGLRQRPFGGVDQHQRAVDHVEDALDLAAEIGVARGVDDVDAGVLPEDRGGLGQDGDAALALEIVGIHRPLGHPLVLAKGAGLLQQPVDQGGLAMVDMGDDGDVAKVHAEIQKPSAGRKGPFCGEYSHEARRRNRFLRWSRSGHGSVCHEKFRENNTLRDENANPAPPWNQIVRNTIPLARGRREATIGTRNRRSRALVGCGQKQAAGVVCLSAVHPGVRHVQSRLPADERRARVHAAAGPAADRGLYAGSWPVRFIDENIRKATAADFAWADVVVVSGMHVQAPQIHDITERAHAAGKPVMLGGPSASASPEMYPDIDYLHIGEMGDATDRIIALVDESAARPAAQMQFVTKERLPLQEFPIPAYDLIPLKNYLMLTMQFSSGCPYLCEFCDIPNLYGRQPRLKTPPQITAELDAMRRQKASAGGLFRR